MKAHEETWEVRADETGQHRDGDVFLAGSPRAVLRPFGNARYREGVTAADRARLAAAAPEMARLLLELHDEHRVGANHVPHSRTIAAVLRKAGVLPT